MPPRIPLSIAPASALRISSYVSAPTNPTSALLPALQKLSLHTSASLNATTWPTRKAYDPYAEAKAKKIRERNIARQAELEEERNAQAADPVLGHDTPFLLSLQKEPSPLPSLDEIKARKIPAQTVQKIEQESGLNHFLTPEELEKSLEESKMLGFPPAATQGAMADQTVLREQQRIHEHSVEAVRRITSLGLGSRGDATRAGKQRCIATLGRHVTDLTLPKDPTTKTVHPGQEKTPRVGPDTVSSEVQAAILTAKIRSLAEHVKNNKKDKMNKRNLRVLCHKRQKLLKYLKRKEKGGIRYRNCLEMLGLDENAINMELMM